MEEGFAFVQEELPVKLKETEFAKEISEGVLANTEKIRKKILENTTDKSLAKIDRLTMSVLYIGTYELCFAKNKQAAAIIINEAIELAKEYGKDTCPSLVNAILSKMADKEGNK